MSSCANGHAVPTGAERCGTCGQDVRPLCFQGHRSAPGSRFCDTCGALLAAEPAAAAAEQPAAHLVTDYTSGSLREFFAKDAAGSNNAAGSNDKGAPVLPAATASVASGKSASAAAAASAAAHVRRARRWQSLGMGLAVLIAAAVIGESVLHYRTGHPVKEAQSPPGTRSTVSALAAPTATPTAASTTAPAAASAPGPTAPASVTPTLVPGPAPQSAPQVIPATTSQRPEPAGPDGGYPGLPFPTRFPGHFVLPGPPYVPGGFDGSQRQSILRMMLDFPGFPRGGPSDHSGGFYRH